MERWVPHTNNRHDLFGFADIVGVHPVRGTIAVQATTNDNMQARVRKLEELESVQVCLRAGWRVEVWGWRKYAQPVDRRRWRETVIPIRETAR